MTTRERLHEVIFEADTPLGKAFDVLLLIAIMLSVTAVCLETVSSISDKYGHTLRIIEWSFTILFTIEYALRLYAVRRPMRYATSFFGIVDVLAILPTYLSLLLPGTQSLVVIRAIRFLRVFRVLKLAHFLSEARTLQVALAQSRRKITVFLGTVLTMTLVVGALMYLIEGPEHGFTSVPQSIYWAIVTMTTVGYGDIAPETVFGKILASFVMIIGYGVIAVPTGIVSVEMANAMKNQPVSTQACPDCSRDGHMHDAKFCKFCGFKL
jgi:voltage-gated potassium channel